MKYVAYYRVSTNKQARSGLGLKAQTQTVESFVARKEDAPILAVLQEAEIGKRNDQPALEAALRF